MFMCGELRNHDGGGLQVSPGGCKRPRRFCFNQSDCEIRPWPVFAACPVLHMRKHPALKGALCDIRLQFINARLSRRSRQCVKGQYKFLPHQREVRTFA